MIRRSNDLIEGILSKPINWSKFPHIKDYKTKREKAYLLLHIVKVEAGVIGLSASQISFILSKKFKHTTSHQAVRSALDPYLGKEIDSQDKDGVLIYSLFPKAISVLGLNLGTPNEEFMPTETVIPPEVFSNAKGYLKKVLVQANGCYRDCYYDACSTMLRRLFETLIIDSYEAKKLEHRIQDSDGDYVKLSKLITVIINEKSFRLSSQTKNHLSKIKLFGDTGAHSRVINLRKSDIDQYKDEIRLSAEELLAHTN